MGHDQLAQGIEKLCAPLQPLGNTFALLNKTRDGEGRLEKAETKRELRRLLGKQSRIEIHGI